MFCLFEGMISHERNKLAYKQAIFVKALAMPVTKRSEYS